MAMSDSMPDPATPRLYQYPELSRDDFNEIIQKFHEIYRKTKRGGLHLNDWQSVEVHTYVILIEAEFDIAY